MEPATTKETNNPEENVEMEGVNHEVSGILVHTLQQETILEEKETKGSKRNHVSKCFNSDKENPRMKEGSQLALVTTTPSQGE